MNPDFHGRLRNPGPVWFDWLMLVSSLATVLAIVAR